MRLRGMSSGVSVGLMRSSTELLMFALAVALSAVQACGSDPVSEPAAGASGASGSPSADGGARGAAGGAAGGVENHAGGDAGTTGCGPCLPGFDRRDDGEVVVCDSPGVCADNDAVTLSERYVCSEGAWEYSFTDDTCCPIEDLASALETSCDVGPITCSDDPTDPCGVGVSIACSGGVWVLDPRCATNGGVGGQGAGGGH